MAAPTELAIERDKRVGRRSAAFPMNSMGPDFKPPAYVALTRKGVEEIFRFDRGTRETGYDVIGVGYAAFGGESLVPSEKVSWRTASTSEWHKTRFKDPSIRFAALGLFLALIGLSIDASFTVGKEKPIWYISHGAVVFLLYAKFVLQIVGLALAFWKGVLDSDK